MAERTHPEDPAFHRTMYEQRLRERYAFCEPYLQDRTVLDVPCGTGWGSSLLSGYRALTGMDLSGEAVAYARAHYPGIRFVEGAMQTLPFDEGSFDIVICLEGLEHVFLSDARRFLAEAHRVLGADGMLIVTAPLVQNGRHSGNPYHLYEFQEDELRRLLEQHFEPQVAEVFAAGDGPALRFVGRRRAQSLPEAPTAAIHSVYEQVQRWLAQLSHKNGYRYADGRPVTLIGTACAIVSLEGLGQLTTEHALQRQALIEYLQGCQEEASGLFRDPLLELFPATSAKHDQEYLLLQMSYFALIALDALGSAPLYPLSFLDRFQSAADMRQWLAGLEWSDAWLESNRVMFVLAALVWRAEQERDQRAAALVHTTLDWLDSNQDSATGLWGTDRGASLLNGMAAAYHFVPFYEYLRRPLACVQALIDSTLTLQQADGMFGAGIGGGACEDLDAVGMLAVAAGYTDYRADDVRRALVRCFWAMLGTQNSDGGFCYTRRPDDATYRFSSWAPLEVALRSSDVWATWSRLIAIGTIRGLYPDDTPVLPGWRFRRTPGLGFHRFGRAIAPYERDMLVFWQRVLPGPVAVSGIPQVSVVVSCYNLGDYLYEALSSVLHQTLQPIDIVVVDDGSTDPYTCLVLDQLDHPQVRVLRLPNGGVARARNTGIRECRTPYICCLDADDRLLPAYLEQATQALDQNPQYGFATPFYREFDGRSGEHRYASSGLPEMLVTNRAIVAALFRREAWERAGGYSETLSGMQDWDLWIGMLEAGYQGMTIPEILFEYRVRANSMYTTTRRPENYARLRAEIIARHPAVFERWYADVITGLALEFARLVTYAEGQTQLARALANSDLQAQVRGMGEEIANLQKIAAERAAWIAQVEAARDYHAQQATNWEQVAASLREQLGESAQTIAQLRAELEQSRRGLSLGRRLLGKLRSRLIRQ